MSSNRTDEHRIHIPTPDELEALHLGQAETPTGQEAAGGAGVLEPDDPARLRAECERWRERALRAMADYQNLHRRSQAERRETAQYALAGFLKALLPVIDDLERLLGAAQNAGARPLGEAVRLIYENLLKILKDHRVEPIPAQGRPFDPAVHEAVTSQQRDDLPDQTVVEEFARGYRLAERVLRPAKVMISRAAPPAARPGDESKTTDSGG